MQINLLSVPYDTALRGLRMGAGPDQLLRSGAADRLRADGHHVQVEEVILPDDQFPAEIRTAFELQRAVAARVLRAARDGALPIVLAGNCNAAALGMLAGLQARKVGVLWLDSHGDFNTPETTIGGFLDGMALAMATGRCWQELVAQLPGFEPVDPADVVLLGARDLDPLEAALLADSDITVVRPRDVPSGLAEALGRLRDRVRDLYVHIDLDVLDPVAHGRANVFAAPDGLTVEAVTGALERVAKSFRIRGAAFTAYDPAFDGDGRVRDAALSLVRAVAAAASRAPPPRQSKSRAHSTEDE